MTFLRDNWCRLRKFTDKLLTHKQMEAIVKTDFHFPGQVGKYTGKVRDVYDIDGNDMGAIVNTLESIDYHNGKPHLVVLRTTKGFHVSLMENILKWHHGVPTAEEYAQAMDEITRRIEDLRGQL